MRRSLFGSLAREWKSSSGSLSWGTIDQMWAGLLGGWQSRSGVAVNWLTALRVTTVLACTRRIAEGVSTVPVKVYRGDGARRGQPATDHPLYDLLDSGPNDWQDSLQFRETMAIHAVLAGGGFAFVNRVGGKVAEMIPLLPDRCVPKQAADYSVVYEITASDGTKEVVGPDEVLHVRGLSWDGYRGLDTVKLAREAIGLSLATEQTHSMLHANGARPSGIVSVKGLADEARLVRLAAWVKRHYGGLENASRVMVLDDEAKFTPIDMTGVDGQHIAVRQHEVEEICRAMGVMPMVIGHPADMAARAAVEQILMIHLVHTVRPWHRRFEKAMNRQLLTTKERQDGYYTKFLDGEFLRAAAKDRAEYYRIALGGPNNPGWLSVNDIRGFEDAADVDGGDVIFAPTNLVPIDKAAAGPFVPPQNLPSGG